MRFGFAGTYDSILPESFRKLDSATVEQNPLCELVWHLEGNPCRAGKINNKALYSVLEYPQKPQVCASSPNTALEDMVPNCGLAYHRAIRFVGI